MTRPFHGRPFDLVSTVRPGGPVSVARFVCGSCEAKQEFTVGDRRVNPEAIVQKAQSLGWDAPLRSERATCPRCLAARKRRAAGESPSTVVMATTPSAEIILMAQPSPVTPRPLTADQRLKIRALLDKQFDDAKGCYLDGYSDQRVATEADVPRIHVESIREAAYGPIRENPEAAKLRADVQALRKDIAALEARLADLDGRMKKALAA